MNIAFWSPEDGCGTTSSMAAVASVCSDAWNLKTILIQSRNQDGDLYNKLENPLLADVVREERTGFAFDGLEFLLWQAEQQRITTQMVKAAMAEVVKQYMYYLPQGGGGIFAEQTEEEKSLMWKIICHAGQLCDLVFIDCGSGDNELSEYIKKQADVVVVNLLQERTGLDRYFAHRHMYPGKTVCLINQYQQDSVYNRQNLNRLYRLGEEESGVLRPNPFFRHASDRGRLERFIRRHIRCGFLNQQYCFMQELMRVSCLILQAGGWSRE